MYKVYQSNIFVSSGDINSDQFTSGGVNQLSRVQNASFDIQSPRENIIYLNQSNDQIWIDRPLVKLNYEYLVTNGYNERCLGFFTNLTGNAVKRIESPKNYYLVTVDNPMDLNFIGGYTGAQFKTLCLGNMYLTDWTLSASVNDFIKARAGLLGYNALIVTGAPSGYAIPSISISNGLQSTGLFSLPPAKSFISTYYDNPADNISALTKSNIILSFPSGSIFGSLSSGDNGLALQTFNCSLKFNRNTVKQLGYQYPNMYLSFPIEINVDATAILNSYQADILESNSCIDSGFNFSFATNRLYTDAPAFKMQFNNMKLESQNITMDSNQNYFVSFNWKGFIFDAGDKNINFSLYSSNGTSYFSLLSTTPVTGVDKFGNLFIEEKAIYQKRILENDY